MENRNSIIPAFSAFFFLIHPIQTEAVAYIAGRTDLLATLFILLSLTVYLNERLKLAFKIVIISILYLCAILSKESSLILPALILLIYLLKNETLINLLFIQLPLVAIATFYTVLRLTVFNFQNTLNFYGTENIFTTHILVRIYTFLSTLPEYTIAIFFPLHLHPERTLPIQTSLFSLPVLTGLFILILSFIAVVIFWKKNSLISYGILWFYMTIFLSSNILIPVNAIITEHWLYTPSVGIFLIFGIIFAKITKLNKILFFLPFLLFLLFSFRTIAQNTTWRNQISLYTYILKYNPKSARVHNNLGMAYADKKDYDTAITHYQKAIKISDTYPQNHHNLANAYKEKGKYKEAILEYKKALSIDPNFAFSYKPLKELIEKYGE